MLTLKAPHGGFGIGVVSILPTHSGDPEESPCGPDIIALEPELEFARVPLWGKAGYGGLPEFPRDGLVHFAIAVDLSLTSQASHQLHTNLVVPSSWIEAKFSSDDFYVRSGVATSHRPSKP